MIFESGKVLDNYRQQHTAINHIYFGTGGKVIEPPTGGGHGTCAVAYQSGFVTIGGNRDGIHSQVDRFYVNCSKKKHSFLGMTLKEIPTRKTQKSLTSKNLVIFMPAQLLPLPQGKRLMTHIFLIFMLYQVFYSVLHCFIIIRDNTSLAR